MEQQVYDTLILSDVHLGAEMSRARDATRMLKETSFRRLILLGDIFADLNFGRLKKEHWQFLGTIRKLSNPKRNVEVVWVEGNHDHGLTDIMSHLVGVKVFQEYAWEYAGCVTSRSTVTSSIALSSITFASTICLGRSPISGCKSSI